MGLCGKISMLRSLGDKAKEHYNHISLFERTDSVIIAESSKDNYFTQLSNETTTINADVTIDKGGKGEHFRPHDLICAGYASCLNINIRMILEQMSLKYDKVITKVDIDREEDRTTFLYYVEIMGDIDDATKKLVISKSLNCAVKETLSKTIEFQPINKNTTL